MIFQFSVQLDVDDDRSYSNGLAALENVTYLEWTAGMNQPYQNISIPAVMRLTLNNGDGRYSQDNSSADYYGLLHPGRLIRVRTTWNGTTVTMTELRITDVMESFGEYLPNPIVQLVCMDKMKELLQFEYFPELQQDVRVDEVLTKIHQTAQVVWPNNRAYFFIDQDSIDGTQTIYELDDIDFDEARTTLDWVGDHLGQKRDGNAQRLIRDVLKAEVFGMYFFQPRTGLYRFLNRHHSKNASVVTTLRTDTSKPTAAQTSNGRNPYGMGPLNKLTLTYKPRATGTPASVLYESDNVPITLQPNKTRAIRGKFFDPNNDDARVGGVDVIDPVAGLDIIANTESDGSGDDVSDILPVSWVITGSSIEYTFTNLTSEKIYVTTLRVRGTPLISYQEETVEARNDDSFYAYDGFEASDSLILGDGDMVQSIADMMVSLFAEPKKTIDRLSLVVTASNAAILQTLTIGDKVTVQNSDETHDKDYIIMGEQHRLDVAQGKHEVHYVTRAVDAMALFTIDTDMIDGLAVMDI